MCDFRVDLAEVAAHHGRVRSVISTPNMRAAAEMAADGLVTLSESTVGVTDEGRDFVRSVCAVFDRYLDRGSVRHAQGI